MIELLIFISITSVILGAIASAFIAGFRTTAETDQRLLESHDREILAAWFGNDVQSAGSQAGDISTSSVGCAESGATPLVFFRHRDIQSGNDVTTTVSYVLSGSRVERRRCSGAPPVVTSLNLIASQVSPTITPTVTCNTTCTAPARTVTLTVTDKSSRTFSLRGSRRTT